jgi:hypothetical protein
MKKTQLKRRLSLRRETVLLLQPDQMRRVAGGDYETNYPCISGDTHCGGNTVRRLYTCFDQCTSVVNCGSTYPI